MIDIKVPEAGESITEGVLLEWHVDDGAFAKLDDPLFELETDKITMTVVAEATGQVKVAVPAGERVEMGQVVGQIDTTVAVPVPTAAAPESDAPAPAPVVEEKVAPAAPIAPPPATAPSGAPLPAQPGGNGVVIGERQLETLSPSVRRMITENSIDPANISGTGRGGRITKQDVINFLKGRGNEGAGSGGGAGAGGRAQPSPEARTTRKPMSSLRRRIAQRLVQSQQTAAILTTFNEADMSAVMGLRKKYKEHFEKKHGVRLGFMSFFVKAVVDALQAVPALNAQIDGDDVVQNHFYDIGVAVGTEHGLVVPVVRDCDEKTFAEIETEIGELATRARDRKLELRDLEGGCFTISNGGVYGSLLSTPILNPPQSGILGLHTIKKRPIEVNDAVVIRPMMYFAMSYDHRLVDGSEAVTFLKRIKECIEAPDRILLDI